MNKVLLPAMGGRIGSLERHHVGNARYNGAMSDGNTDHSGLPGTEGPGTYVLFLHLLFDRSIAVGKLGEIEFPAGFYLYVGSALGPGGLAARLRRHKKLANGGNKRLHWHIDYLREKAQLSEIWYSQHPQRLEHEWASVINRLPDANALAPGFGSSDCSCLSHLYHVAVAPDDRFVANRSWPKLERMREAIRLSEPDIELIIVESGI